MEEQNTRRLKAAFDEIDRVIADPLRFKLRLGIGDDAYKSLRLKKRVQELWDMGGAAATGAAVASSTTVATTFFAPTGFWALLGFGTAVTPFGWVVAAALGSAGAYYGVMRLFGRYAGSRVDTIPKFINSEIDLLGAALMDLMGALAVRVAQIDGNMEDSERIAISDYFTREWGFDSAYVARALDVLVANAGKARIKDLARQLAQFLIENPDCNAESICVELLAFLREIAEADGVLDEREELALDAIASSMGEETSYSLEKLARRVADASVAAGKKIADVAEQSGKFLGETAEQLKQWSTEAVDRMRGRAGPPDS